MEKLIELDHVTAGYDRKIVLRDICLSVWEKDFLGIIGPNGGGKTTLLKIILGLLTPISGEIKRFEDKTSGSAPKIGYLPQMSNIDRRFPISVREVIASGLAAEKPAFKAFSESQNRRVDEVIAQMGCCLKAPDPDSGRTELIRRQAVRVPFLPTAGRDQP